MSDYQPSQAILNRYAAVLVNCGLGHGHGITPGDVVVVNYNHFYPEFTVALQTAIAEAGGIYMSEFGIKFPEDRDQLETIWNQANHRITIKCVKGVSKKSATKTTAGPSKIELMRQFRDNLRPGEKTGWQSYTLAYLPTPHMASETGVTLEAFWDVLSDACCLQQDDPVSNVRDALKLSREVATKLSELDIRSVHVQGDMADLQVYFVPESTFVSADGGNVPSFESFRTPAASRTEGWIICNLPTLFKGELLSDVRLEFKAGVCTGQAVKGNVVLQNILGTKGGNQLGEFALTDKRLSGIRDPLPGNAMFLENIGGTGHIAVGNGYPKCFPNKDEMPDRNESPIHHDFIFSGDFTVTATLQDGSPQVIWKDGQFTFM